MNAFHQVASKEGFDEDVLQKLKGNNKFIFIYKDLSNQKSKS